MQNNALSDVEHTASLLLQVLLFINVYLSLIWTSSYGLHVWSDFSELWDFQGQFVIIGYFVAAIVEAGRLNMGYSGNLRSKTADLSIFLIATLLLQMPCLAFLVLSLKKRPWITNITYLLIGFLLVEFIVGITVWRKHSYHQVKLYQLKIKASLTSQTSFTKAI